MRHASGAIFLLSLICLTCVRSVAQNLDDVVRLHSEYRFSEALEKCEKLLSSSASKEEKENIFKQMLLSENGQSMLQFSCEPRVLAKKTVPRKDFFLWYSHLSEKGWTADGNWFPHNAERYYYSEEGDIFTTFRKDSLEWSAPVPPVQDMNSKGTEIFPFVSPDGKELFFSSDGLFGMGGFDIFVSRWDDEGGKWGPVQNMGFPFSSVKDDLLFTYTPDNNYIVFASNRECGPENVVIYVVKYENYLRKMIPESEAKSVASLPLSSSDGGKYEFVKHSFGERPSLAMEVVEPEIDYTFRSGKESFIVPDNTLPKGIVYQVRIYVTTSKVKQNQLKGFSPVFEVRQKTGKYIYYVGLFRTYSEVSSALKQVKAKIPGAYAVAWQDGKSITVQKAKELESKIKVVEEQVRIVE
ncbi:MAG: PD40 domain-containing protein [Bacteroidales bacterium]|nr:PD40 domain-containing protein [Candidatus Cacconaster merdequi]